jgi:hypothetical protein
MRLIDADKLLRDIEKYHVSDGKFQHWVEIQPTIEPERKTVWRKTYDEGFPAEADLVLVTNGKSFWVDESVANDVGLEWAVFDGCWEDTEWAHFKDLRGEQDANG